MPDEGKNCPKCGAEGETHVHTTKVSEVVTINDVGWYCRQCDYHWGFEYPPKGGR